MHLNKGQVIELPDSFVFQANGSGRFLPISNISVSDENIVCDITTSTGFFQDSNNVVHKQCSAHSIEYIKKFGLDLDNIESKSAPAKHARSLTVHLNTFLASMQAYYAGALGLAYVNIMYAPYLEGMTDKEIEQEAQHLMYQTSQNAFSRGGQALFIDFNLHSGIPGYLKNIEAIGPGGKYTGKKYAEYTDTSLRFLKALLKISGEGDKNGAVFAFPKLNYHVNAETFKDPKQTEIYNYACEIAAKNGSIYFVFDRDDVTLTACCRLRTAIDDNYMIDHPESMRYCGFQNVTINLPQCAYRAGKGNTEKLYAEIEKTFDLCVKAHLQKREFTKQLMSAPHMPLWQIARVARDGRPYVDLDKSTYIVGLIGLNECVQYMYGKELHDGEDTLWLGIRAISYLYFLAKGAAKKYGLKFSLEESPAESASRRLAKMDVRNYKDAIIRGSVANDDVYYTNSIHVRPDAKDVSIVDRIVLQSKFHNLIESGAIVHAFVGENLPSAGSIANLVKKAFENTDCAQLTISPEFTMCRLCGKTMIGLKSKCCCCGAYNLDRIEIGELNKALDAWPK